jgi:ribosomal-protein-alanine N-acetyltransferase
MSRQDLTGVDTAPSWRLRPARARDVEEIAAAEPLLFPDEAWDLAMLLEELLHPARSYVVVREVRPAEGLSPEREGALLGYAGVMVTGDVADLHTIGALREGRGMGQAMLAWCEQAARNGGADRLLLEVREDNVRARAFYDRAGFTQIARRRGYYRTAAGAIDALVLQKDL